MMFLGVYPIVNGAFPLWDLHGLRTFVFTVKVRDIFETLDTTTAMILIEGILYIIQYLSVKKHSQCREKDWHFLF